MLSNYIILKSVQFAVMLTDALSHHVLDVRDELGSWEHSDGDLYELQRCSHHLSRLG